MLSVLGTASIVSLAGCSGNDNGENDSTDTSNDDEGNQQIAPPAEQQAKLVPDDSGSDDIFGNTVAISNDGSTAIIGAVNDEDPNGADAGAAYVFSQANSGWQQQTKLTADDGTEQDYFGSAVAVSNDGSTAIFGANGDDNPNGEDAGAAYVFS